MVCYTNHGASFHLTIEWLQKNILKSDYDEIILVVTLLQVIQDQYTVTQSSVGLLNQFATKVRVLIIDNIDELYTFFTSCSKKYDEFIDSGAQHNVGIVLLGIFKHFTIDNDEASNDGDNQKSSHGTSFLTSLQVNANSMQDMCYQMFLLESYKGCSVYVNDYSEMSNDSSGKLVPETWTHWIPINDISSNTHQTMGDRKIETGVVLQKWITII